MTADETIRVPPDSTHKSPEKKKQTVALKGLTQENSASFFTSSILKSKAYLRVSPS